jgi:hypothetical protein
VFPTVPDTLPTGVQLPTVTPVLDHVAHREIDERAGYADVVAHPLHDHVQTVRGRSTRPCE